MAVSAPAANVPRLLGEQDLLTREQAQVLLEAHGCTVHEIVRVHLDSILYLAEHRRRPMTAWLARLPDRIEVRIQYGFVAEPAYGLLPRPDVSTMYPDDPDEQDQA